MNSTLAFSPSVSDLSILIRINFSNGVNSSVFGLVTGCQVSIRYVAIRNANAEYLERMSTSAVGGIDDPEWYGSQHSAYFVVSLFFLQGQRCCAAEIMLDDRFLDRKRFAILSYLLPFGVSKQSRRNIPLADISARVVNQ